MRAHISVVHAFTACLPMSVKSGICYSCGHASDLYTASDMIYIVHAHTSEKNVREREEGEGMQAEF